MLRTAAALLVLLTGCVHGEQQAGEEDALRAQREAQITLYGAGESFEGLPPTATAGTPRDR